MEQFTAISAAVLLLAFGLQVYGSSTPPTGPVGPPGRHVPPRPPHTDPGPPGSYCYRRRYKGGPPSKLPPPPQDDAPGGPDRGPYYPYPCCGYQQYNAATHMCCGGQLVRRKPGYYCCGRVLFNMKSQLCCAGTVLDKTASLNACCYSKPYHTKQHRCCYGNLVPVPSSGLSYQCCGNRRNTTYDPRTHLCCRNTVTIKSSPTSRCCGHEAYNPRSHVCCGGKLLATLGVSSLACCGTVPYDRNQKVCCGWKLYDKPCANVAASCCGSTPYISSFQMCCARKITYKPQDVQKPSCCGSQGYNSALQVCCGGRIFPKRFSCCGQHGYNPATQECCKRSYVKPKGCCSYNYQKGARLPPNCFRRIIEAPDDRDLKGSL